MAKWYETRFVNRRDWLLDHLELFELNNNEKLLVMIIDFLNTNNIDISYDKLAKKLNIELYEIDTIIKGLINKGVLNIYLKDNIMCYDLSSLFEYDFNQNNNFDDIYHQFEDVFKRPLNQTELQKITDFIKEYQTEDIIDALRVADAYNKISIAYIETVLRNKNHG